MVRPAHSTAAFVLLAAAAIAAAPGPSGCARDGGVPSGGAGSGGRGAGSGGAPVTGAGGSPGSPGSGGSNSSGSGGAPAAGAGSGGAVAPGGSGGGAVVGSGGSGGGAGGGSPAGDRDGGGTGADGICQEAQYKFEPKIPTVVLLVDRSGSMFPCLGSPDQTRPCQDQNNSAWTRLKNGVLQVVEPLQARVRFGFVSFTGTDKTHGDTCPMVNRVPAALNNFQAISDLYRGLPFRGDLDKWETPTRRTLEMVGAELMADTTPGDKFILFVTDGEPDYCGDGNPLCPPDAVVAALQTLKAAGITTIVMGLLSAGADLPPGTLQAFANAGAGEPTLAPLRAGASIMSIYDECFPGGDPSTAGWRADFLASGKPMMRGQTLGTYAAAAGPTRAYAPDVANQTMLVHQLTQALSSVKSCTFDLGNVGGRAIRVDPAKLDQAHVIVMGREVPRSDTDGWRMNSATELELTGGACTNWRLPANTDIDFQFPCGTIIFE